MKRISLWACSVLLLTVFPILVCSQTSGGRFPLGSKTWAFVNQTTDLSPTVLFTPVRDSDFIVTISASVLPTLNNTQSNICPQLQWTDEGGQEQFNMINPGSVPGAYSCLYVQGATHDGGQFFTRVAVALPIHVLANTPVTVSAVVQDTPSPTTYNLHVGRIKLNP